MQRYVRNGVAKLQNHSNEQRGFSMRRGCVVLLIGALIGAGACGGDGGTEPGPAHESIADSYAGVLIGISEGVALNSTFSLTIAQSGSALSGSWGLSGTLNDGVTTLDVAGTGTLTGSIAAGNNPSVNMTVRVPTCPNYQAQFSGAYDVSNRRLTIAGPVVFFAANSCTVVLSYPSTIILTR
jgi:hypothetical protein